MSRLPSNRGSSASSASSRSSPASAPRRPGVLVQSPKSDIYVVILGVALGAIILACLLMIMVFSKYGFSTKVAAVSTPSQATAIA